MTPSLRLELFPADLAASISFYERVGFAVASRDPGPPAYAFLRWGDVRLGLVESPPADARLRHVPTGAEIVLEVDDVDAVRDGLVQEGIPLAEDLTRRPWGMTDVRVHDPDGYYLRFTDRG